MEFWENICNQIQVGEIVSPSKKADDKHIEQLVAFSSIEIPSDYLQFLKEFDDVVLEVPHGVIYFYTVNEIFYFYEEYGDTCIKEKDTLVIADDLGDLVLFFGKGKEGYGIYLSEKSNINYEHAYKICDSITKFLIYGDGLDKLFYQL